MHASAQCLHMVDSAYHASLRFTANCKALTHHCELYSRVGWPALATCRLLRWCTFVYKGILGLLPQYLCVFITQKSTGQYSLRSQNLFMLSVPNAWTEVGKRAFGYSAPSAWNLLQNSVAFDSILKFIFIYSIFTTIQFNCSHPKSINFSLVLVAETSQWFYSTKSTVDLGDLYLNSSAIHYFNVSLGFKNSLGTSVYLS